MLNDPKTPITISKDTIMIPNQNLIVVPAQSEKAKTKLTKPKHIKKVINFTFQTHNEEEKKNSEDEIIKNSAEEIEKNTENNFVIDKTLEDIPFDF